MVHGREFGLGLLIRFFITGNQGPLPSWFGLVITFFLTGNPGPLLI